MIDYRHFRRRGYLIGSGSVESNHKHVVHSRLKQASMGWAEEHVDPMLSSRNLIWYDRWAEGWQQQVNTGTSSAGPRGSHQNQKPSRPRRL